MALKEKILNDLKEAMRSKDQIRLQVLRSLKAKLLEKEISERKGGVASLNEEQSLEVLMKAAKQRKESIFQFEQGNRSDLAEAEKAELEIIEEYLPKMMTEEEIEKIVEEKIFALGATGPQDMGKVMGPIMGALKGKADGGVVSKIVKQKLNR